MSGGGNLLQGGRRLMPACPESPQRTEAANLSSWAVGGRKSVLGAEHASAAMQAGEAFGSGAVSGHSGVAAAGIRHLPRLHHPHCRSPRPRRPPASRGALHPSTKLAVCLRSIASRCVGLQVLVQTQFWHAKTRHLKASI